jgi:DNA-directed RNA polymerase specialized sigma24 family protein
LLGLLYFTVPEPSYDEIAARTGMPRGSLGPTRRRCLEKLRRLLAPRFGLDVSGGEERPPRR